MMSSLLRQWPVLETVMPVLMLSHPLERLVAWNVTYIDNAIAVALAYLHCQPNPDTAQLIVFHSGPAPALAPIDWAVSEVRSVPPTPWLEPVEGKRSRRRPHRRLLESVLLGRAPTTVDLLIAGPEGGAHRGPDADALAQVRPGGHVLFTEAPPEPDRFPGSCFRRADPHAPLFRKISRPNCRGEVPPASEDSCPVSLSRLHEQALLVDSYTNLARSLARRFAHRGERLDDLEQVAYLALVRAASRYDPSMGRPFSAFAAPSIVGELKRHFRDRLWMVRPPRSVQEMNLAIRDARDELTQRHGASPTIAQIASHIGANEEDILYTMEAATNSWATSLDSPHANSESPTTEVPVIDGGFDHSLDRTVLEQSIKQLSPTEQVVLKRVFFENRTQRQVAEELGVSQMQISRLITKTLKKMRTNFQPA